MHGEDTEQMYKQWLGMLAGDRLDPGHHLMHWVDPGLS